jgi:starch synthase
MPLICEAFRILAPLGLQLVILGAGDPGIEAAVRALVAQFPSQVAATVGFDEGLAHLIEGGADAFLMPSAYEPCGLNQMYSQRYGTVPIVHATGGLKDTVSDYTAAAASGTPASGFAFDTFDAPHLVEAILRAWRLYSTDARAWHRLMRGIMGLDHSWARSAREYLALYQTLRSP